MAIELRLTDLTDDELDEKIQKLTRIVFSNNINLSRQAQHREYHLGSTS